MTLKILTLIGFVIILPLFTRAMDPDPNQAVDPDPNQAVDPNPNPNQAVNPNQEVNSPEDPPVEIVGYNGVSVSLFSYVFHELKMILV